jgi:hypothetical protein
MYLNIYMFTFIILIGIRTNMEAINALKLRRLFWKTRVRVSGPNYSPMVSTHCFLIKCNDKIVDSLLLK